MPAQEELAKFRALDFAARFRAEMVPLSNSFQYFSALPLAEDELKEYLDEPIAALPPAVKAGLPPVSIVLVPYLARLAGKPGEWVTFEKPAERMREWSAAFASADSATLVFSIKNQDVADYHYTFYRAIATVVADRGPFTPHENYFDLLREELRANVHGEVDAGGWETKQALLRRQGERLRDTKVFRAYARQSFIDTLTLYLHGICCDIDVETGPRQLPSRHLRKRLELFLEAFPPPDGFAVFPEQLNKA